MWLGPEGVAAVLAERTGKDPQTVVDEATSDIPIRRFTTAEDVGDLVAFLASARAGAITGTTVRIDGGLTPSLYKTLRRHSARAGQLRQVQEVF